MKCMYMHEDMQDRPMQAVWLVLGLGLALFDDMHCHVSSKHCQEAHLGLWVDLRAGVHANNICCGCEHQRELLSHLPLQLTHTSEP